MEAPSDAPVKVTVGAYVNDIQQPDFKSNSYAIDLYVWFRWGTSDLDPYKTLEFMNRDAADDSNLREPFYDTPEVMPDGSLYQIIRYRGQFSTKFRFDTYPFDTQTLKVVLEDSIYDVTRRGRRDHRFGDHTARLHSGSAEHARVAEQVYDEFRRSLRTR